MMTSPKSLRTFTLEEEVEILAFTAFIDGYLLDLHAGKPSELLNQPRVSRTRDGEMCLLNIRISQRLAYLLRTKDYEPLQYAYILNRELARLERWQAGLAMDELGGAALGRRVGAEFADAFDAWRREQIDQLKAENTAKQCAPVVRAGARRSARRSKARSKQ